MGSTEFEINNISNYMHCESDLLNASSRTGELLPCPFCGNEKIISGGTRNPQTGIIVYNVFCPIYPGCGASVMASQRVVDVLENAANIARVEAVKKWNTRINHGNYIQC